MKTSIVISGGGSKGAFSVGALKYIAEKNLKIDSLFGISTGALQSVGFGLDMTCELLLKVWLSIKKDSDIYSKSLFGVAKALLGLRNGLYSFDGLRKILERFFDKEKLIASPVDVFVGKVNLQTSEIVYVDKYNMTIDDVIASCTIPVFFPSVREGRIDFVDGGVRDITPLNKSIELGSDRVIVILCSPRKLSQTDRVFRNPFSVFMRVLEILLNEIFVNDIEVANLVNVFVKKSKIAKDMGLRRVRIDVIEPDFEVSDSLEFNPDKIRYGIEHGYEKARSVLG